MCFWWDSLFPGRFKLLPGRVSGAVRKWPPWSISGWFRKLSRAHGHWDPVAPNLRFGTTGSLEHQADSLACLVGAILWVAAPAFSHLANSPKNAAELEHRGTSGAHVNTGGDTSRACQLGPYRGYL